MQAEAMGRPLRGTLSLNARTPRVRRPWHRPHPMVPVRGLALFVFEAFLMSGIVGGPLLADDLRFDRQIAPLIASRCLSCHSGDTPEAGLDLSRLESSLEGGDSGPALVPGDAEQSLLYLRVHDGEMPPDDPLRPHEVSLLHGWIEDGATWSEGPIDPFRFTTAARAGYDWWSLQPLTQPFVPDVDGDDWSRSEIDRFVLRALRDNGLEPSPEAPARILIRRLYLDLTGLPPPPSVVEAFERDPSERHYERLVDRLLASPHYGERWGRHWLDVARFGESDGFERNNPRTDAWPFRDWVISALNDDMPYDQFARLQIAGDHLLGGNDGGAAVGFLVAGVHNTVVGSSERMKRLARQDELEEIVAALGQTFLGLTINCARCHDHKFDPIGTRDYYRMIAMIDGVQHGQREVVDPQVRDRADELAEQIARLRGQLARIDGHARDAIRSERHASDASTDTADAPDPIAAWEFDDGYGDAIGNLDGQPVGGAGLEGGALVLDGKGSYVMTDRIPWDLTEKTLEAWVVVDPPDQGGGGVISLQTPDGAVFDAIVYGEQNPRHWMAGSNNFARTQPFGGEPEAPTGDQAVHVAITYASDGSIRGYRNGQPYGQPYWSTPQPFAAGQSVLLFGLRHSPAVGNRMFQGRILRAALYDRALDPAAIERSCRAEPDYISDDEVVRWLGESERLERQALRAELELLTGEFQRLESSAVSTIFSVVPAPPGPMRIHIRGSVTEFGDEVSPGGVAALEEQVGPLTLPTGASDGDRRVALAEWIARPDNPLFVRTMVNRIWYHHFGRGLVPTPNDLGFNGGQPTHSDLLEWLAQTLRDDGFRLKSLHKRIVMSSTYRQSSAPRSEALSADAQNRWLWRVSPRRIDGETLRDSILEIAGQLNRQPGGPGFIDVRITPNNGTTYYFPFDAEGAEYNRRTVYRFSPRGERQALLDVFDCPDPSTTTPKRNVTTTPLQALSLLNSPFVLRMSDHFARRLVDESGDDHRAQVERAWRLTLSREPDPEELELAVELVEKYGLPALCRTLFNCDEFVVVN